MAAASPDMRVPVGSLITWELTPAFSASVRKVIRERLAAATGRSKRCLIVSGCGGRAFSTADR
jgi:hypothetical protein